MLSRRGEVMTSISMGTAGTNLQAAVAVTNHFGILASGHYANNAIAGQWRYRSHRSAELGLGYFQKNNKLYFEIFGGVGVGKGYAQDSTFEFIFGGSVPKISSGEYVRFFMQPSIGLGGHVVEGAVTARLSVLSFSTLAFSRGGIAENPSTNPRVFFEPAFTFRIYPGGGKGFISTQAGVSTLLNERRVNDSVDETDSFEYAAFQMSVGVGIRFGKKSKTQMNNSSN
jgi:hypothetical protein